MKEVVVFGKKFKSMSDACAYYEVNQSTITNRLKKGMSLEEAISKGSKKPVKSDSNKVDETLIVRGMTFNNVAEACEFYNISKATVDYRMKKMGMSLEEALTHTKKITSGQKITVEGREFDSISEACKFFDLNYYSVMKRINRGMSPEEAILSPMICRKHHELDGVKYNNLTEVAREYKVSDDKLSKLVYHEGMPLKDAVDKLIEEKPCIVVSGKKYSSIGEACDSLGVNKNMVYSRLAKGLTIEEAISMPKGTPKSRPVVINGIEFKTIKDACAYFGNNYEKVMNRIYAGVDIKEAITSEYIEKTYEKVKIDGVEYPSLKGACRELGLPYATIRWRVIEGGMSIEDAVHKPIGKEIKVNGMVFKNLVEVCKYYNKPYDTIKYRVYHGMSLEEALSKPIRKGEYGK